MCGAQPDPGWLCLSEEAWEAAGTMASGGEQWRLGPGYYRIS